jgi:hypothetical protein
MSPSSTITSPRFDADAEDDPLALGHRGVALYHALLHRDGAGDRFDDARKFDENAAAGRVDNPALMLGDLRVDQFAAMGAEPRERAGLVLAPISRE